MRKYRYSVLLVVLVAIAVVIATFIYGYAEQKLKRQVFQEYQQQTADKVHGLIENQQHSSKTLAMSLAENPFIEDLLVRPNEELRSKLSNLVTHINTHDGFKNLWVQLINVEGHSIYRSWTGKVGDDLTDIRPEVGTLLQAPKMTQTISVGRFSLTFKSIVPVVNDKNHFLGLIEVITQFTPLVDRLREQNGIDSILLTDKRYRKQLTKAITGQFVDDYYVTNDGAKSDLLALVQHLGAANLVNAQGYVVSEPYLITRVPVQNEYHENLAYWLTFTDIGQIDFTQTTWVLQKYLVISLSIILLLLLLFMLYMSKHQSDREKRYYRQIIDSVSDIIYIANGSRGVDVNRHFLEFFKEYDSVESVLEQYDCISDAFEEEEGFLTKQVNGQYWLDYVLNHPKESHRVKIVRDGVPHIFLIKVKPMRGLKEKLYNVLMQDVTQIEEYEKELKTLTVTDELTGAGNRLACNQALEKEIQRSRRYHTPVSIIMYDIDHFKKVNDTYGHDVGDKVLVEVTKATQQLLRNTDVLCRYGGEEFLIILPETDEHEAYQIAQRLKEAINSLTAIDVPTQITVSLGVAELTKWDTDNTLLKRVDKALYKAKQNGRDRVEVVAQGN
ncbi:diguanylate cyclase [Thiomicrorhabdus sp. ZW0627]|uniref:diguanylate cyclase n=1 Tax=Thiomicrorhabdus sp. ZW0627 TaxID=3039774 RepID=UPI00243657D0|nr:diguanylate cyclase [Thiomicrorhabdus sp. ZW0627]MDG6773804.1 diguanylate cyclase [Thiomicrorhabdus sp. ZW0627]